MIDSKSNDAVSWLIQWFESYCDGDWEHANGIDIKTTSNPGWSFEIGLEGTAVEYHSVDSGLVERSTDDWYSFEIREGKFIGIGDLSKLEFLIETFRAIVSNEEVPM